jgi:hypothetical protein
MDIADDDAFDYHDVERMIDARRGLGRRCDRDFVQQLVDGSVPSVRAQEYGLLTLGGGSRRGRRRGAVQRRGGRSDLRWPPPERWAGIRLDREGIVQVVVASFTSDLEGHRARLAPLVARPDRLRLPGRPFSARELARVQAEIEGDGFERIKQLGIGDGAVEVALVATAESLGRGVAPPLRRRASHPGRQPALPAHDRAIVRRRGTALHNDLVPTFQKATSRELSFASFDQAWAVLATGSCFFAPCEPGSERIVVATGDGGRHWRL